MLKGVPIQHLNRMATVAPQPLVMTGGAREHLLDIARKYAAPLNFYVGMAIILGCVFVKEFPVAFRAHADSLLGRFTLFLLVLLVADLYSWQYGLLMAVFTILLLSVTPRRATEEAFVAKERDETDVKMVTQKERWFIEKVMQEEPVGIEEDKVRTSPIQDASNGSNSTTSSK